MCLVAQVSYITSHKFAVNTGFQINYGLPFSLKGLYSPVFFPIGRSKDSDKNGTSIINSFFNKFVESNDDDEVEETTILADPNDIDDTTEINELKKSKRDLSAGEFYYGMTEAFKM